MWGLVFFCLALCNLYVLYRCTLVLNRKEEAIVAIEQPTFAMASTRPRAGRLPLVAFNQNVMLMKYENAGHHSEVEKEIIGKLWQTVPFIVSLFAPLLERLRLD